MKNLIIYFSGTGNTKILASEFALRTNSEYFSIESAIDFKNKIVENDIITLCFPIHLSSCPMIMVDFMLKYKEEFKGKNVISLATQQFFSGDGALSIRDYLEDINIIYAEHFNMPSNIVNAPVYSKLTRGDIDKSLIKVRKKLDRVVNDLKSNNTVVRGNNKFSYQLGLGQRKAFVKKNRRRDTEVLINDSCILCDNCVKHCPTKNLVNDGERIVNDTYCTLCYRCVNICPKQCISVIGSTKPYYQYYVMDKVI